MCGHKSLCLFLLYMCVVATTFVNLLWRAMFGCLCQRPGASAVFLCVCVVSVRHIVHECKKKDHQSLCVSPVWLCDVKTSFVNMFGGAKCGCLCRRSNVSVRV